MKSRTAARGNRSAEMKSRSAARGSRSAEMRKPVSRNEKPVSSKNKGGCFAEN
ncbi:MAG: hypothetical protein ACLVC5_04510 [Clostridia bacterium]